MAPKIVIERRKAKVKNWENHLTPLEIAAVLESDPGQPFEIAALLKSGQNPVAYVREAWSEDASYYTSRKGAKRLIVGFTGSSQRPGIPISCLLQSLRDGVFDVVLLRDPSKLHYTHGIRALGGFLETMRRIEDFAGANGFQQIITFGTSAGGLPALRAGRLLKAHRAISIGGRYAWHPGRLTRNEKEVHAFDLLCACASPSRTELVVVYARGNEKDKSAFDLVKRTVPECTAVPIDTEEHGVLGYFWKARLLPLFLACLFDYWDEAEMRTDLLARLDQAARQTSLWESLEKGKRSARLKPGANEPTAHAREWLRSTPFWSLTWPVRALRRVRQYSSGFLRTPAQSG
jgi:hypothetical protein